jgi:F-type H+-transporting ATPase subunit b
MFSSLLLIATTATEHSEEAANGITKITHDFGVNVPNIAAQALSFAIVAFVLWRFGFKPVLATLDERQKKIESGLKYADDMQAKLAATAAESAQLIKNAQLEAVKVVEEARKASKEFADKQNAEATARAADTLAKAQQAIELEHKKMLNEARGEIARLVVKTTEQVLAKKLSEADRAAYNDAASKELTSV